MASNTLNTIQYDIIPNPLGKQTKYRGMIYHPDVLNKEDLLDQMVGRNTTVTRQDALAVIDLYEEVIKNSLRRGYTVSTGLFRADLSLKGVFESLGDKMDPKRHKAKVVIRPAINLSKNVCRGLSFRRQRHSRNNSYFSIVISMGQKLPDKTIASAGVFQLRGKGLKSYLHENSYNLTLKPRDEESGEKITLQIITTSYKRITAMVPHDVKPGRYLLQLTHEYGQVKREFTGVGVEVVHYAQ